MQIWRIVLSVALLVSPTTISAEVERAPAGTWTLEHGFGAATYVLASRGSHGDFLICFNTGNVRAVVVSAAAESSILARGSCTVFSPDPDHGIVVDFHNGPSNVPAHSVALGSFRVILPRTTEAPLGCADQSGLAITETQRPQGCALGLATGIA